MCSCSWARNCRATTRISGSRQRHRRPVGLDQGQLLADRDVEDLGVELLRRPAASRPLPHRSRRGTPRRRRGPGPRSGSRARRRSCQVPSSAGSYSAPSIPTFVARIAGTTRHAAEVIQFGDDGDGTRTACRRNPRLPQMPAAGRVARGAGGGPAAAPPRRGLLGEAARRLRRPRGVAGDRRAGPGGPRRQPDRTDVHRRPLGRVALRGPAPRRPRQPPGLRAPRRRPAPRGRLHHRGRPLRAAGEQADAGGARQLPALPGAGAASCSAGRGRSSRSAPSAGTAPCGRCARSARRCRGRGRASATRPRPRSAAGRWSAATTRASRTPSPAG